MQIHRTIYDIVEYVEYPGTCAYSIQRYIGTNTWATGEAVNMFECRSSDRSERENVIMLVIKLMCHYAVIDYFSAPGCAAALVLASASTVTICVKRDFSIIRSIFLIIRAKSNQEISNGNTWTLFCTNVLC